jgi:hypothetical protein
MDIINYQYPIANPNAELIVAGFGLSTVKTLLYQPGSYPKAGDRETVTSNASTRDNLGRSVFALVSLEAPAHELEIFNSTTKAFERVQMPATSLDLGTVLVDVTLSKNIVTTAVNGLNGTVKEYIADDDYKVTFRGALVNTNGTNFPFADFKKLQDIVKAPVSLKVVSDYLGLFPIHNLVITDYTFPQKEGYTNTQLFEISALSDNPIEITRINF